MASFTKGPGYRTPFGMNTFLRSTEDVKTESYTVAASTVPTELVDGVEQKMLKKGEALAKITSGPEEGKVGPFQAGGTSEVQTLTENVAITAGTFTLTVLGDVTGDLAFDITAANLEVAINALDAVAEFGSVTVAGGPVPTAPFTLTFFDVDGVGQNVAQVVVDGTDLTGSITVATSAGGVDGATDGRQTAANIVGLNNTFLPWQLMERDVEVAAVYECTAVQARCTQRDASGGRIALTNTTADAMRGTKGLDILFK